MGEDCNIVRVDITWDGGKTWYVANVVEAGNQPFERAWVLIFWNFNDVIDVVDNDDKMVQICSRTVDMTYNIQTETCILSRILEGQVTKFGSKRKLV